MLREGSVLYYRNYHNCYKQNRNYCSFRLGNHRNLVNAHYASCKSGTSLSNIKAVNQARRAGGEVETSKKYGAGGNKQSGAAKNTATLDQVE